MTQLNRQSVKTKSYPIKVIQFGAGNFIRAFIDWIIQILNTEASFEAGVIVVKPTEFGDYNKLKTQNGLFTLFLEGIKNNNASSHHYLIDCIQGCVNPYKDYSDYLKLAEQKELRFVFSNTTESGIVYNERDQLNDSPQQSFPGKLTALLYNRFQHFRGDSNKGLIIIPCELINQNGDKLKKIILQYSKDWSLGEEFEFWIQNDNYFCNTLVDRIVSGYPHSRINSITSDLGYNDDLVVMGELFHLLVIEGPKNIRHEFTAETSNLNVVYTENLETYRTQKVRILNGAHTSLVPVGYLYGIDKVRESINDPVVGAFLKDTIFKEICPTLKLSEDRLHQYANDVLDRFKNPYLEHSLMSISLNSISKYKIRVLPSVLEYFKINKTPPTRLLFSLAALIAFYKGERNGKPIELNDSSNVVNFFSTQWASNDLNILVKNVLTNKEFWGEDLTRYNGLEHIVVTHLQDIITNGMETALKSLLKNSL